MVYSLWFLAGAGSWLVSGLSWPAIPSKLSAGAVIFWHNLINLPVMRQSSYLLIFLAVLTGCCGLEGSAQNRHATIRLVQDDMDFTLGPEATAVTLQKKSFRIQIMLEGVEGVYVHIGFRDSLYRLSPGSPLPGYALLPSLTMAEEAFNKEKELLVNEDGWSYWFYDPALHWHRFNKRLTFLDSGRVVGTKTVKQLFFVNSGDARKLKEISEPLYLFFWIPAGKDGRGNLLGELQRERVKIDWKEED